MLLLQKRPQQPLVNNPISHFIRSIRGICSCSSSSSVVLRDSAKTTRGGGQQQHITYCFGLFLGTDTEYHTMGDNNKKCHCEGHHAQQERTQQSRVHARFTWWCTICNLCVPHRPRAKRFLIPATSSLLWPHFTHSSSSIPTTTG